MEPFIYDRRYPFVFCQECQWACIVKEVGTHLASHHHATIQPVTRKAIIEAVQAIPGLIESQTQLAAYTLPDKAPPIPYVAKPERDGLRCRTCGYVTREVSGMRRHCRERHGWVSDWKKGGHIKAKKQQPRQLPWTEGIWCQRLFRSRAASSWFEVQAVTDIQVRVIENTPRGNDKVADEDENQAVLATLDEWDHIQEQRYADGQGIRRVEELDPKNEANSWLQRVGWTRHLEGLEVEELQQLVQDPGEEELLLQCMCEG